ncbi:leucyl phenylalanyl-trna--protein transferase [Leptolyngbya sp. Heron Island J]|uniref:leucyl/phenylalanyl-tRNA--protein transferase n=1 Tax=Leptolyngbya sp. Heron Island J TaxID=1385935 RepID=UPI0003B9DE9A|nr:leucyl/phenylalanyl-tRNA--protein transferase [Leptolyngbya sp. Heron Island J]ESA37807.1 leucyl phenylalanyl-trna--protein transferase [Leptolyngbya sp. Heron Island J]
MAYSIPHILQCYAQGYFLMADSDYQTLNWYSSRKRALIPLDDRFRYPKSLRRVLNQNRFEIAFNRDFDAVVEGCANRETTWISDELKAIYRMLHRAGHAHSFEAWQGDQLAGAILGIVLGGAFIGESMFFTIPDGSKVAMVKLVEWLRSQNFLLFDAQMMNPHLARFGAYIVESEVYEDILYQAIQRPCQFLPLSAAERTPAMRRQLHLYRGRE